MRVVEGHLYTSEYSEEEPSLLLTPKSMWTGPVDGEATPSVRFAALGVQDLGGDSSQVIPALYEFYQ